MLQRLPGPGRSRAGWLYESRTSVAAVTALLLGLLIGIAWGRRDPFRGGDKRTLHGPIHDFAGVVQKTEDCGPAPQCDCSIAIATMEKEKCPTIDCATEAEGGKPIDLATYYAHDQALRPVSPDLAYKSVCMVVRTFVGHRNTLMAMLASVLLWDHPSLTIYLVDTGAQQPFTELPRLARMASAMAGRPDAVRVSDWTHATSRAQFPDFTDEDHGYIATDLTIEDILSQRAEFSPRLQDLLRATGAVPADGGESLGPAPCEYMIVTNGDNLYGKEYLAATLSEIRGGAQMVSTHWVSHYEMNKAWILGWGEVRGVWRRSRDALLLKGALGCHGSSRPNNRVACSTSHSLPLQIQNGHCGPWRPGRDGEVAASPVFMKGCVDLGVVTFKTSLLEESGFRFAVDRLRTVPQGQAPPKDMFAGECGCSSNGTTLWTLCGWVDDAGAQSRRPVRCHNPPSPPHPHVSPIAL